MEFRIGSLGNALDVGKTFRMEEEIHSINITYSSSFPDFSVPPSETENPIDQNDDKENFKFDFGVKDLVADIIEKVVRSVDNNSDLPSSLPGAELQDLNDVKRAEVESMKSHEKMLMDEASVENETLEPRESFLAKIEDESEKTTKTLVLESLFSTTSYQRKVIEESMEKPPLSPSCSRRAGEKIQVTSKKPEKKFPIKRVKKKDMSAILQKISTLSKSEKKLPKIDPMKPVSNVVLAAAQKRPNPKLSFDTDMDKNEDAVAYVQDAFRDTKLSLGDDISKNDLDFGIIVEAPCAAMRQSGSRKKTSIQELNQFLDKLDREQKAKKLLKQQERERIFREKSAPKKDDPTVQEDFPEECQDENENGDEDEDNESLLGDPVLNSQEFLSGDFQSTKFVSDPQSEKETDAVFIQNSGTPSPVTEAEVNVCEEKNGNVSEVGMESSEQLKSQLLGFLSQPFMMTLHNDEKQANSKEEFEEKSALPQGCAAVTLETDANQFKSGNLLGFLSGGFCTLPTDSDVNKSIVDQPSVEMPSVSIKGEEMASLQEEEEEEETAESSGEEVEDDEDIDSDDEEQVELYLQKMEKKREKAKRLFAAMKNNPFLERLAEEEDEFGNVIENKGEDEDEDDFMDDDDAIRNDPLLQKFLSDEKMNMKQVKSMIQDLYRQQMIDSDKRETKFLMHGLKHGFKKTRSLYRKGSSKGILADIEDESDDDLDNFGQTTEEKVIRRLVERAQFNNNGDGVNFDDDDDDDDAFECQRKRNARKNELERIAKQDEEDEYGGMVASAPQSPPQLNPSNHNQQNGNHKKTLSFKNNDVWMDRKKYLEERSATKDLSDSTFSLMTSIKIRDNTAVKGGNTMIKMETPFSLKASTATTTTTMTTTSSKSTSSSKRGNEAMLKRKPSSLLMAQGKEKIKRLASFGDTYVKPDKKTQGFRAASASSNSVSQDHRGIKRSKTMNIESNGSSDTSQNDKKNNISRSKSLLQTFIMKKIDGK